MKVPLVTRDGLLEEIGGLRHALDRLEDLVCEMQPSQPYTLVYPDDGSRELRQVGLFGAVALIDEMAQVLRAALAAVATRVA